VGIDLESWQFIGEHPDFRAEEAEASAQRDAASVRRGSDRKAVGGGWEQSRRRDVMLGAAGFCPRQNLLNLADGARFWKLARVSVIALWIGGFDFASTFADAVKFNVFSKHSKIEAASCGRIQVTGFVETLLDGRPQKSICAQSTPRPQWKPRSVPGIAVLRFAFPGQDRRLPNALWRSC
jgi:hypothetical protein